MENRKQIIERVYSQGSTVTMPINESSALFMFSRGNEVVIDHANNTGFVLDNHDTQLPLPTKLVQYLIVNSAIEIEAHVLICKKCGTQAANIGYGNTAKSAVVDALSNMPDATFTEGKVDGNVLTVSITLYEMPKL